MTLGYSLLTTIMQNPHEPVLKSQSIDSLQKIIVDLQAKQEDDKIIKYITTIGSQWPMVLLIVVVIFLILYRKRIGVWASNIKTVKGGIGSANVEITTLRTTDETIILRSNTTPPQEESGSNPEMQLLTVIEPTPNTESDDLNLYNVWVALREGGLKKGKEFFERLQLQTHSIIDQEFNTIFYFTQAYKFGLVGDFQELEKISKDSINNITKVRALQNIASIHSSNAQFDKAIDNGLSAITLTKDIPPHEINETKVIIILQLNAAYMGLGREKEYIALVLIHINGDLSDEQKSTLYKRIADVYKSLNLLLEEAVFLIKATDCVSNNTSLLFDVAHAFSNLNNPELALHYYRLSKNIKEDQSYVLNNMAVALDDLTISGEAGKRFTESYLLGNSLAGANIANKYINIGMFDSAKKMLNEIKTNIEDVHMNVYTACDNIEKLLNEEKSKTELAAKDGLQMSIFYRKYAEALENKNSKNLLFNLESISSENITETVSGNDTDKSVNVVAGTSTMEITLQSDEGNFGSCKGVLSDTTKQYLIDSFTGYFVINESGLHIALSHVHRHYRRDCRFYHLKFSTISGTNDLLKTA